MEPQHWLANILWSEIIQIKSIPISMFNLGRNLVRINYSASANKRDTIIQFHNFYTSLCNSDFNI
jgi:hypothetical protein